MKVMAIRRQVLANPKRACASNPPGTIAIGVNVSLEIMPTIKLTAETTMAI